MIFESLKMKPIFSMSGLRPDAQKDALPATLSLDDPKAGIDAFALFWPLAARQLLTEPRAPLVMALASPGASQKEAPRARPTQGASHPTSRFDPWVSER